MPYLQVPFQRKSDLGKKGKRKGKKKRKSERLIMNEIIWMESSNPHHQFFWMELLSEFSSPQFLSKWPFTFIVFCQVQKLLFEPFKGCTFVPCGCMELSRIVALVTKSGHRYCYPITVRFGMAVQAVLGLDQWACLLSLESDLAKISVQKWLLFQS